MGDLRNLVSHENINICFGDQKHIHIFEFYFNSIFLLVFSKIMDKFWQKTTMHITRSFVYCK